VLPSVGRRLLIFYVVLVAVTAAVTTVTLLAGKDLQAERPVAGGYDVAAGAECVGPQVDLTQSGRFVTLRSSDQAASGQLEVNGGRLTGSVRCRGGRMASLEARAEGLEWAGTLGGQPVRASLRRDPPDPGARRPRSPTSIAGRYRLSPASLCIGGRLELEEAGDRLELIVRSRPRGEVRYAGGRVSGDVICRDGRPAEIGGQALDQDLNLTINPGEATPASTRGAAAAPAPERLVAARQREFPRTLAAFFIAVAAVMLVARLFGWLALKVRQPRVMGEVVAGIILGPTVFGALLPKLQSGLFPTDIIPYIGVAANLGLIFYMFLVGLELDPGQLRGRVGQAAAVSNASVALPMVLGIAVALPIFQLVGPQKSFVAFALFMGVAMSITAFPVLARILVERRMLKRPVGALALACAAIDDVTAWFLIALATAVATAGSGVEVARTIALAIAFCLVMVLAVRPILGRASGAFDEVGRVPGGWIAAIFAGVLLSAYVTEIIGIALIFGAFVMGMVMPRHAGLTEDVTRRVEDFVVTLLLPLFFAYTGLRTNIGLLDRPELWGLTAVLLAIAIVGKFVGATVAARLNGFGWRPSAVVGTLMNTRGLTELIVLNLALEAGVISEALFAMLVLMALVTTFMAGPLLRLLDPRNELGAPVEDELEDARRESRESYPDMPIPNRSILVAPQSETGLAQLRSLAEPLARSEPPRELILARLVQPPRGASVRGGLQTENRLLSGAAGEVGLARLELVERGIAARAVAFISATPGADLSRLADSEEVDLTLVDGRRPLLGEGVPRGRVGDLLAQASCDVAVLVARDGQAVRPHAEAPVIVPFGGAEHDWAALELAAWIASATGAPLKLLGAAGQSDEGRRVTRLLGDAGLLVQQYTGVMAQPMVAEPGRAGVVEAATGAGLLTVGLSERWRQEGLGPTRSEIAREAPAPVLFVRRGTRPGALAPREDVTRFSWSSPPPGQVYSPGGSGA